MSNGGFTPYGRTILPSSSVNSGAALSIQGDMEFTKSNSFLEVDGERVSIKDLVKMTKMFKRLMFDIANDPELSKRFPYATESAHEWTIEELKK